jgi:hypothetical protein
MLPKLPSIVVGLALCMAGVVPNSAAQEIMKFSVKGENPGGRGGYQGEVTLSKLSKSTAKIRWVTGTNQEVTNGFAIRTDSAIGAGYGGEALLSLVVYELKGETIEAVWATAAKPEAPGTYVLKGNAFKGTCSFADGSPGSVTFVPGTGGMYKVTWELTAGRFEGIGVRTGNILVAASGAPRGLFGVAAYVPKGKDIAGVWATTQTPSPGKELWSLPPGAGPAAAAAAPGPAAMAGQDGQSLVFGGDTYLLKENKSAPGQTTSELREYLQEGETWEGYRKMVGLHMQNVKGADAARLARATLEMVQKQHPNSYVKEIDVEPDSATVLFIVVKDNDVEFNLWNFRKATTGVACAQFVLRNKPPFDSRKKFKAEQDDHIEQWTREIETLGGEAERLLAATAKVPGSAASAPDPAMDQAALAKVINADIEKCVAKAEQYLALAKAGKIGEAVNLMTDAAFENITRAELVSGLESENKTLGKFKSFTPDKEATDFGVKNGIMTYLLHGDTQYENGSTREVFRFYRNKQGEIEFTGYNRSIKE